MRAWLVRLQKFADRPWYGLFVAVYAMVEQLGIPFPAEMTMVPAILLRPATWVRMAALATAGCTAGAVILAAAVQAFGVPLLERLSPGLLASPSWAHSAELSQRYGIWALFIVSIAPLPQQPAVAIAALGRVSLTAIGLTILVARIFKFGAAAYLVSHAPKLAARFPRLMARLQPGNRQAKVDP